MKKIVVFSVLVTFCCVACNKELSRSVKKENAPNISVFVENESEDSLPGNDGSNESFDEISPPEQNEHSVYTFLGVTGLYFGCTSSFKTGKEKLEFIFGTSKTTALSFTRKEFEQLIQVGERQFGSLGAFTSFPERLPGKVEIAYTDNHGRRWCSTRISESKTNEGVEATVKIEQDGWFFLEEAHKIEIAAETEGYRLKGKFECTLYEVNRNAKRKMKGQFMGIVAPQ